MSGPFRKAISIVSDTFHTGSERKEILSIELSLDGFSFAIIDVQSYRYVMVESYKVNDALAPNQLFTEFEKHIKNIPLLFGPFEKVNIAWYHPHFVLVPESLFQHSAKDTLFRFCSEIPAFYQLKAEKLNNLGAFGIYPVPEHLQQKLGIIYPGHKLRHTATVLIESILASITLGQQSADVVLHFGSGHFEVVLLRGPSLIFYNSFAWQTFDDLIYFLFYVLEQFKLDAANMEALVAGNISLDSEKFELLVSYFNKVNFFERSNAYRFGPEFDNLPHHYFHNLINLNACG